MNPETITLRIEGMTCGHCVRAVENALSALPGVEVEAVEIGRAEVRYDPAQTDRVQIARAIEEEGYTAHLAAA
ncbi:MAG TPA: cation transporter [Rubricoccaceae bacterium]|nr:cation transporter [Rubricoccaceae bacterium]